MDYGEALSKIESLENGSELISAIKQRVEGILDEKRRAVSTSNTERDRASQYENLVNQIFTLTGAEGDNPVAKTQAFTNKFNSLLSESSNNQKTISALEAAKNAAEQARTEAETKLIEADRNIKVTEAAIASKANPNVLKKLLTDSGLSIEVTTKEDNSKEVLVLKGDEKLILNEYAQSNWADFLLSLFPANESRPPSKPPQLPGGNPGGQPDKKDAVKSYITAAGFGPRQVTG